jgi:hypothetical protein
MRKFTQIPLLLGCLLTLGALASQAHAQSLRTFVSGAGSDSNPCSRTAPCRTFAGAYAQTVAGGEIDVLDAAGYGSLTITQSISIINDGAGTAGITATSGADGIDINAPGATVNLRGLVIDGVNNGGTVSGEFGVSVVSAAHVSIQNCLIQGFYDGIFVAPNPSTTIAVRIQDTSSVNNANEGIEVSSSTGSSVAFVAIERSRLDRNGSFGMYAQAISSGDVVTVVISDSSLSLNFAGLDVGAPGGALSIDLSRDLLARNYGLAIEDYSSTITVGDSMFSHNGSVTSIAGGAVKSYGTNQVTGPPGNGFSGTATLR